MSRRFIGSVISSLFLFTAICMAQDTVVTKKTDVIKNPDGSYTVIEYPVGKEVVVNLLPGATLSGARGSARMLRSADGTKVYVDLSGVSGDTSNFYAYAVDPSGMPTYLGPVAVQNGLGKAEFTTPMNQFMVVLSPTEGLNTIDSSSNVVFRSEVPAGYAVVPTRITSSVGNGKQVAITDTVASAYDVPLLNVPSFNNKTTEIRINFKDELKGLKGKAYIDPGPKGSTKVKMRFDDMKMAPKDKRFVLWAAAPDGSYTKLGQVINAGNRQESEIRSETALRDFGLFVTMEDVEVGKPTSRIYSAFERLP